jgi:fibronectin type 3 domain-containing protein
MKFLYHFLIVVSFILFNNKGEAQPHAEPGNIAVEHGVFIYTGNELPKNAYYLIERKEERNKKYMEIAKTTCPKSLEELNNNAKTASTYFKNLSTLSAKDLKRIFNYTQNYKVDDSLYRSENLPIIAIASGTGFLDTTAEKDKTYQYKISLFKDGKDTSQKELNPIKNTVITNLPIPKAVVSNVVNNAVYLEWVVAEKQDMALFNVFRAYFGTLDFKKIEAKKGYSNSEDGLHLIAVDSTTEKSSYYKYYIQPVDMYGNVSEVSEVISAGKLQSEPIVPISSLKVEALPNYQIKLSWKLDQSTITSNIQVLRSDRFDDGFIEIMNLPPNTSEFIDNVPKASENFYYYLKINGGTGQEFSSSKIAALIKTNTELLAEPKNVEAVSIKNGIEISWEHSEPYTHGFYVYRATTDATQFNLISNLIPFNESENYLYKDEDKSLKAGEMYQYTVRAENDAYTLGKISDTVSAFPGIKTSIIPPQQLKLVLRDSIVELFWKDLTEIEPNVLGYKIYRQENNDNFKVLPNDTLKPYKNYYNDKLVKPGKTYNYQVTALDVFGVESGKSQIVSVTIPVKELHVVMPNKPIVYKNSEGITVSWGQISSEEIDKIKIYRSEGNANSKEFKTVSIAEETLLDNTVKKGNLYYYKISYLLKDGKESHVSNEVSINF